MQLKQPAWEGMPVLNVRSLTSSQTKFLAAAYDEFCRTELMALASLNDDRVRIAIDNALTKVLNLPDISYVRALLANESGLTGTGGEELREDDEPQQDAA